MSLTAKANGVCSKCGQTTEITVYKSINTADNPELKEKVKNGSLFLWECPHCGTVNLARYETLYHDPQKKLMLWLVPDGKISETQMQAITNHTKAMGGYTLRLVRDMGELLEKVLIFDAGLDVFLDEWSITPGDVLVHSLDEAIPDSSAGILVFSPHALASPWVRQQYAALLRGDVGLERGAADDVVLPTEALGDLHPLVDRRQRCGKPALVEFRDPE